MSELNKRTFDIETVARFLSLIKRAKALCPDIKISQIVSHAAWLATIAELDGWESAQSVENLRKMLKEDNVFGCSDKLLVSGLEVFIKLVEPQPEKPEDASGDNSKITDEERAIIMAYTGFCMLTGEKYHIFTEYVEKLMGRPVFTHEYPALADTIRERAKADFIKLCS